uniref:DUF997 family protein n=1 Tax=Desulfatirhabdium butyrativorans TaxID=340467 RepID=A0A7C4RM27_9BACT
MKDSENDDVRKRIWVVVLWILAVLTWCPLGYGSYGAVDRLFGMPVWAAVALIIGAVLFLVEWYFLFRSGYALDDDKLFAALKDLQQDLSREVTP